MRSSIKNEILKIFEAERGEAISGEDIAKKLSVSRAAVCKAVSALKKEGYDISARTNKGYVFSEKNDFFSSYSIDSFLKRDYSLCFDIRETVDSTNNELKKIAETGGKEGYVLIAENQTSGKGRMGHSFFSPGTGLYMSILLRPNISSSDSLLITTAAAVAVSRAIEGLSQKKCEIKWVNDIFSDGKKLCGILTEASIDFETGGLIYAVLGIGINLSDPEGGFPPEIKDTACSVFGKDKCSANKKSEITAAVCENFFGLYFSLGSKEFMKEYKKRSFLTGKNVDILSCGEKTGEGEVLGIDDDAHLIVRLKNGETSVLSSGEVSVKPTV